MSSPKARPWLSNTDRLAALGDWVHAYATEPLPTSVDVLVSGLRRVVTSNG